MKLTNCAFSSGVIFFGEFLGSLILEVRFKQNRVNKRQDERYVVCLLSQVTVRRIMQLGFLMYVVAKLLMRSISFLLPLAPAFAINPIGGRDMMRFMNTMTTFLTRKIAKRKISDIWAANIERHAILGKSQLGIPKFTVIIGIEKILCWSAWIQDRKLGSPNTIFDRRLCILKDRVAEGFSDLTIYGTAKKDFTFPR
jgi:hypothetical protein